MEDTVCRTCLSSSDLEPIFKNSEDHDRYSTTIFSATSVYIGQNDGLPQYMCVKCTNYLNDSLKFQKKCRDTEEYLLKIKNQSASTTLDTKEVICKLKNCNYKGVEGRDNVNCNTEQPEYVYYDDIDNDDDKPLKHWLNENTDINKAQDVVFIRKECLKNEESKLIIPTELEHTSCQFCSKKISIRRLSRHIAEKHPDTGNKSMTLGDKVVVKEKTARQRKTGHGDGKNFKCWYCNKAYYSQDVLLEHIPTCTKRNRSMKQPKKQRLNSLVKEFTECHICHKTMLKTSIKMHVAIKHEGKGPVCEHCGRRFANNRRLSEHRRALHGHAKFKCTQCDYQSAREDTLQNHERLHRGERPFVCEACGVGFHSLHLLHQHKQSHRTEKAIKCDQCPAVFKANNSLHVHKMTCHSATAFRCGLCARTFGCRTYAVRHIKHVHSLEQPASALERIERLENEK